MGGDPRHSKRKTALYALGLFGSLFAVAMWGKMRFVTDLPRIAYAVPENEKGVTQDDCCDACQAGDDSPKADQEREPAERKVLEFADPQSGEN